MTSALANLAAPAESGGPARVTLWLGLMLAAAWALLAAAALLVASVKLHSPGLLADVRWLTYGRLQAGGQAALLFGFLVPAAALLGLNLLGRLAGFRGGSAGLPFAGTLLWNAGAAAGFIAVLRGQAAGMDWLDFPAPMFWLLLAGSGLWALTALAGFCNRGEETETYPSVWFLLAALLALPWFLSVVPTLGAGPEAAGVLGVVVRRWALNGVVALAAGGVGLAGLLYLVPKLAGVPLASRQLALLGFWTWAFCTPWAATFHGDPVPRWLVSAGVAGRIFSAIAFVTLATNFGMTLAGGGWRKLCAAPGGRWVAAGLAGWLAAGVLTFLVNLRGGSALLRLTWFTPGLELLVVLGFLLPVVVALTLDAWPAISDGRPAPAVWRGPATWLVLGGTGLVVIPLLLAGLIQGAGLHHPDRSFLDVLRASLMPVRLVALGWVLLVAGLGAGLLPWLGLWGDLCRRLVPECRALQEPVGEPKPSTAAP